MSKKESGGGGLDEVTLGGDEEEVSPHVRRGVAERTGKISSSSSTCLPFMLENTAVPHVFVQRENRVTIKRGWDRKIDQPQDQKQE